MSAGLAGRASAAGAVQLGWAWGWPPGWLVGQGPVQGCSAGPGRTQGSEVGSHVKAARETAAPGRARRLLQGLCCPGWCQSLLLDLLPQPQRPAQHRKWMGWILMLGATSVMHASLPSQNVITQHVVGSQPAANTALWRHCHLDRLLETLLAVVVGHLDLRHIFICDSRVHYVKNEAMPQSSQTRSDSASQTRTILFVNSLYRKCIRNIEAFYLVLQFGC